MQKVIIIILSCILLISSTCNVVLQYRLEQTRQQLEYVRVELSRSRENYRVIADGLGRTSEILSKSAGTVKELREQIYTIRETFEDMEDYINSIDNNM